MHYTLFSRLSNYFDSILILRCHIISAIQLLYFHLKSCVVMIKKLIDIPLKCYFDFLKKLLETISLRNLITPLGNDCIKPLLSRNLI